MAIVVIGGHSRSVGKTSVVAGLIAALPACNWSAFKITQFGHGRCSLDGKPCDCATEDRCWAVSEEHDRSGKSDTSRFLAAGAKRAFWVRTEQGRLDEAMPAIRRKLAEAEQAILESNSVLEFLRPDLYITVLDPAREDFKVSAHRYLERADAVVWHEGTSGAPCWPGVSPELSAGLPLFRIVPPRYVNSDLVEFVAQRLQISSGSRA
jgi:hypothetical protein